MSGSTEAVCTSATISAAEVSSVIAQAAPTPCTSRPKLENRLADHVLRNTAKRRGASMAFALNLPTRSEEHTSELQSLMRSSYAVFCLKKKKRFITTNIGQRHRR